MNQNMQDKKFKKAGLCHISLQSWSFQEKLIQV